MERSSRSTDRDARAHQVVGLGERPRAGRVERGRRCRGVAPVAWSYRGAGVPQGVWMGDCRRREMVSAPPCRLGAPTPGFEALSLVGAVDLRAAAAEELGDLAGGVRPAVRQGNQVHFLTTVELGRSVGRSRPLPHWRRQYLLGRQQPADRGSRGRGGQASAHRRFR